MTFSGGFFTGTDIIKLGFASSYLLLPLILKTKSFSGIAQNLFIQFNLIID
jgi:hypothetical protein